MEFSRPEYLSGSQGYPFQYPCLENFKDRGTWQATVHGVTEPDTTEQLTDIHIHNLRILICAPLPLPHKNKLHMIRDVC